jgi:hypothetical protein
MFSLPVKLQQKLDFIPRTVDFYALKIDKICYLWHVLMWQWPIFRYALHPSFTGTICLKVCHNDLSRFSGENLWHLSVRGSMHAQHHLATCTDVTGHECKTQPPLEALSLQMLLNSNDSLVSRISLQNITVSYSRYVHMPHGLQTIFKMSCQISLVFLPNVVYFFNVL